MSATAAAGVAQLKQGMKAMWMAGDFGQIAKHSEKGAEELVSRLNIQQGNKVLDVACGTGNLTIPAARRGAKVTGIDIASNLLAQARQRAAAEGLDAKFEEGDAEQLAAGAGEFDVVMSMFGAMFAPQPEKVAAELIRVCRSGGTIAMANWTREGFVGESFAIGARFVTPPEGIPSPLLWGDESVVKQRLGGGTSEVRTIKRDSGEVLGAFGRNGRMAGEFHWVHNLAIDSKGNIYTTEVDTGKRAQKFLFKGDMVLRKRAASK